MKSSILFLSILLFSNGALAAEPKFLKAVSCETESGDKQVKISPNGKFELTQKDKAAKVVQFESCYFELMGMSTMPDKLPVYHCKTKDRKTGYMLEGNNSGYYNLMETGDFRNKKTSTPNSSDPVLQKIRDTEKRVGTFKCSDPTMDAWIADMNAASGQAQPKKPVRR